jgi:hypothetical protein
METNDNVTLVFAEPSIQLLESEQEVTRGEYVSRGVGSAVQSIMDRLRGSSRESVVEQLKKNGTAMELEDLVHYFDKFEVDSIALSIAATLQGNIFVLTAQASAGITITIKPKG